MNVQRVLLFIVLLLCGTAAQAASGFVVIASNVESIVPGSIVESGQRIELGSEQKLKLMSSSGRLLDLVGPFAQALTTGVDRNDQGLLASLAKVVEAAHSSEQTLAAFRNSDFGRRPPRGDIWGVNVARSGNYCVREDEPLLLWWPDAVRGATVIIENKTRGQSSELRWNSRRKQQAWPHDLAIAAGDRYTAKIDLSENTSQFTVATMPAELENEAAQLVWMSEQGCDAQSSRLLGDLISRNN